MWSVWYQSSHLIFRNKMNRQTIAFTWRMGGWCGVLTSIPKTSIMTSQIPVHTSYHNINIASIHLQLLPPFKRFHVQLTHRWNWKRCMLVWAPPSSIPLKWKGLFLSSATGTWTEERAFAKALKMELIHWPTVEESFLLELLSYWKWIVQKECVQMSPNGILLLNESLLC